MTISRHGNSIWAIFRTKTSSMMYTSYIEMKEGMGQHGQRPLIDVGIGKVWIVECNKLYSDVHSLLSFLLKHITPRHSWNIVKVGVKHQPINQSINQSINQ